jgi:protein disulfide-isomerase A6
MFAAYLLATVLALSTLTCSYALYSSNSDVISISDDKTFKEEVMKYPGVVMVEFFAPWCGHCKSLAPEWDKAATTLKGVAKVVAVDATQAQSLAQKYQIQGFPTIKVFGANKRSPTDYQGARSSDAIITETMKQVNAMVKDRKKGGSGGSSGSSSSSGSKGSSGGSKKRGSEVIELTELNFNALVMESTDHWLVEFYAPWCGHCKALAPEWEQAAKDLKGQVKLGAVDATVHGQLASQYGVKGYPTIKVFSAGPKKKAKDYQGPREAPGIVQYALQTLDAAGVPPSTPQITSKSVFEEACGANARVCAIMFVPHIYDSSAKARNRHLDMLGGIAKSFRGKPMNFVWSEAGAQEELEKTLEVNIRCVYGLVLQICIHTYIHVYTHTGHTIHLLCMLRHVGQLQLPHIRSAFDGEKGVRYTASVFQRKECKELPGRCAQRKVRIQMYAHARKIFTQAS